MCGLALALAVVLGTSAAAAAANIVGGAVTPDGYGWWLVDSSGNVYTYGDAVFYKDAGGTTLNAPIVGMAATADGGGYWLVGSDGGVFTYGDAGYNGSLPGDHVTPNKPIVGIVRAPGGYLLAGAAGGVFNFGSSCGGSLAGKTLAAPIVAITTTSAGGCLMLGRDGGVFASGTPFEGSASGSFGGVPAVAILPSPDAKGYLVVDAGGATRSFGDFDVHPPSSGTGTGSGNGSSPQHSGSSSTTVAPSPTVLKKGSKHPRRRVHAKVDVRYHYNFARTVFRAIRLTGLPRRGTASVSCKGRGCPRRGIRVSWRQLHKLERWVLGHRFTAGDRLLFVLSAPGELTERIEFLIRDSRKPIGFVLA